jgi:hypothetical protein
MPSQSAPEPPPGSAANRLASGSRHRVDTRRHLPLAVRSFVTTRRGCAGAHAFSAQSNFALRIRLQIHVPSRMRRRVTLRADDDVLPIHLLVEERQQPKLLALSPRAMRRSVGSGPGPRPIVESHRRAFSGSER